MKHSFLGPRNRTSSPRGQKSRQAAQDGPLGDNISCTVEVCGGRAGYAGALASQQGWRERDMGTDLEDLPGSMVVNAPAMVNLELPV